MATTPDVTVITTTHFHKLLEAMTKDVIAYTPSFLSGLVIFLIIMLIGIICEKVISRIKTHSSTRRQLYRLIGKSVKVVITLIGLVMALGTMGINVSALVASLGLLGFALGFALKDAISNVLAGFLLLFYEPFRIGDTVKVGTVEGEVIDINLRYIVLRGETQRALVPNATVLSSPVIVTETASSTHHLTVSP